MSSKNQFVQKISKAICKETPDIEIALGVLREVCEACAERTSGPLAEAYEQAAGEIYSAEVRCQEFLFNAVIRKMKVS